MRARRRAKALHGRFVLAYKMRHRNRYWREDVPKRGGTSWPKQSRLRRTAVVLLSSIGAIIRTSGDGRAENLLSQMPPSVIGQGGAASATVAGVEALGLNPAGLISPPGRKLAISGFWHEKIAGESSSQADLALACQLGPWAFGARTAILPAASSSRPLNNDPRSWEVSTAIVIMERPQGGHVLAGLAATRGQEGWQEDIGFQLEPIPMVEIASVLHTYQEQPHDRGWLTLGGAYRLSNGLTLTAERDLDQGDSDVTRFGASLRLDHSWVLRMGSLQHAFTWGVGLSGSSWRVDLAAIADRRQGLHWSAGIRINTIPDKYRPGEQS